MDPKKKQYASESAIVFRAVKRRTAPGTESEIRLIRERNHSFPPEVATEFDLEVSPSQAELYGFGMMEECSVPSPSYDDMPELIFDTPRFHSLEEAALQASVSPLVAARSRGEVLEREPVVPQEAKKMAKLTRSFHSIRTIHSLESSEQMTAFGSSVRASEQEVAEESFIDDLVQGLADIEIHAFQRKQTPTGLSFQSRPSSISRSDAHTKKKPLLWLFVGVVLFVGVGLVGWLFW